MPLYLARSGYYGGGTAVRHIADAAIIEGMSGIQEMPVRLPIRLGQFLKLSGLVSSGAEASDLIAAHDVEVDGDIETRRGRQLVGGEVVTVFTDSYEARARVVDADA